MFKKTFKNITILLAIALISACTVTPPAPKVEDEGAIESISNTADIQMALIKKHGDPERYCAARQGDVADTRSVGGSLSVSGVGVGDGISEGSSQGAISLGGRNPAVLIVREMMYRACELSLNLNADSDETLEIYKLFMQSAKDIASIQTGPGSAAVGQSATGNIPSSSVTAASSSSSSDSSDSDDSDPQGVD